MKYTTETTINANLQTTWDWFMNPANMKKWQPSFIKYEMISGEPGTQGSKSKMFFTRGKGTMEMDETIEVLTPPEYMKAIYETEGVVNVNEMKFSAVDENTTKIEMISDFQFSGIMKFASVLMKGLFVKESQKSLDLLKKGIEEDK